MKKIIYEDNDLLVIDKPARVNADDYEKRIHRLDKDTSGVLLIAKNDNSLEFFQKQFQERKVEKKYLALVTGNPKNNQGEIEALLGRSPKDRRKQKVFLPHEPKAQGKRTSLTKYKVLKRFKNYAFIEVEIKTGRKHQIRAHFSYLGNPIAGDKMYGFRNQPIPQGLERQFLHSSQIVIELPSGEKKELKSTLPEDLEKVLKQLE